MLTLIIPSAIVTPMHYEHEELISGTTATTRRAGQFLGDVIQHELEQRAAFMLLMTQAALDSFWVKLERESFLGLMGKDREHRRMLLPVRIGPCTVPPFLNAMFWIDALTMDFEQAINAIAAALAIADEPQATLPHEGVLLPVRKLDNASFKMGDRSAATRYYVRTPVQASFDQATATLSGSITGESAKQGILVLGAANTGKTRLALEALKATLPDWDALVWNMGDREERIPASARLKGRNLAVFLDDVQNYATGDAGGSDGHAALAAVAGPALVLRTLFQRVCQDADHVVFVATCRQENYAASEGSLGWLFQKLEEVTVPTFDRNEHSPEAQAIIAEFSAHGPIRDKWDGTLGSLVLGLAVKHQEYMDLVNRRSPAVLVLRAMKLLTLGGLPTLMGRRVRAVCDQILYEPSLAEQGRAWDDALETLYRLEFAAITPTDDGDVTLAILKDDYFEHVVTDYPLAYQHEAHRRQLLDVLASLADDEGLFYLGYVFDRDGIFESAIEAYDKALTISPDVVVTYTNKGAALGRLGRHEEALAAFDVALHLDPDNATAYYDKGVTLTGLERPEEALAAYNAALRLNPTDASAYNNKGAALELLKRYDEALDAVEKAIELSPHKANAWYLKAMILSELGCEDEAQEAWERVSALEWLQI